MKIDVNTLNGNALNYAVAKARGYELVQRGKFFLEQAELHACHIPCVVRESHTADTEWGILDEGVLEPLPDYLGDEIKVLRMLKKERIGLERPSNGQTVPMWRAITDIKHAPRNYDLKRVVDAWGETVELAALKVYVMSYLGTVVDIPEELL